MQPTVVECIGYIFGSLDAIPRLHGAENAQKYMISIVLALESPIYNSGGNTYFVESAARSPKLAKSVLKSSAVVLGGIFPTKIFLGFGGTATAEQKKSKGSRT